MRIIRFIDDQEDIQDIPEHPDLRGVRSGPPSIAHPPPAAATEVDRSKVGAKPVHHNRLCDSYLRSDIL